MQIIAVDDERLAVENMLGLLRKIVPEAEITGFSEAAKAFAYMAENSVDIAFLDIELGALSGIELAGKCKELCPDINIIFVTGYTKYMQDAFKLHVSGYLMKPVRESAGYCR